ECGPGAELRPWGRAGLVRGAADGLGGGRDGDRNVNSVNISPAGAGDRGGSRGGDRVARLVGVALLRGAADLRLRSVRRLLPGHALRRGGGDRRPAPVGALLPLLLRAGGAFGGGRVLRRNPVRAGARATAAEGAAGRADLGRARDRLFALAGAPRRRLQRRGDRAGARRHARDRALPAALLAVGAVGERHRRDRRRSRIPLAAAARAARGRAERQGRFVPVRLAGAEAGADGRRP